MPELQPTLHRAQRILYRNPHSNDYEKGYFHAQLYQLYQHLLGVAQEFPCFNAVSNITESTFNRFI